MKAATFTPRETTDGFTVVIRKDIYDHLLDAYDAAVKVVPQGSWARALDAALDNLGEAEEWLWRADDNTLRCASATTEGVTYDANPKGCTCKAAESGKACWHRAAALLALRTFERAYRANHYYLLVRGDERCRMVDATRLTKLHTVE